MCSKLKGMVKKVFAALKKVWKKIRKVLAVLAVVFAVFAPYLIPWLSATFPVFGPGGALSFLLPAGTVWTGVKASTWAALGYRAAIGLGWAFLLDKDTAGNILEGAADIASNVVDKVVDVGEKVVGRTIGAIFRSPLGVALLGFGIFMLMDKRSKKEEVQSN